MSERTRAAAAGNTATVARAGTSAPGTVLRSSSRAERSTPDKLRMLLALLIALSLAWGVIAALTADQHASAASNVVAVSEPLSLDAEQIYQSLSDADATAASAFLSGGLEPASLRQRYDKDISDAAVRIEAASAMEGASAARTRLPGHLSSQASAAATSAGDDLATLSADLTVYNGEVQTARADNRLGLPVGAAYLREASGLLRLSMLNAASDIYANENRLLTAASAQATGLPLLIVAILIGLAICYTLLRTSRWLARHTHRVINTGLLAALVVGVVSLVWLAGAFAVGRTELLHAQQNGFNPAKAAAQADVAALRAHADESLTLIDNTGDDGFQKDFVAQEKQLGPGTGTLLAAMQAAPGPSGAMVSTAVTSAPAWFRAHEALRTLDNSGNHTAAVTAALSGDAATRFGSLSDALGKAIRADQNAFASSARSGQDAFTGLAVGMIVAALVMAAACAWGLTRRLAEYR
ncbi:MAG TPA: hypothetical protein VF070_06570 [Streptosporangiaceae bacterium]